MSITDFYEFPEEYAEVLESAKSIGRLEFYGKADFGTYVDKAVQKILTDPSADPEKEFSEAQSLCEKEALENSTKQIKIIKKVLSNSNHRLAGLFSLEKSTHTLFFSATMLFLAFSALSWCHPGKVLKCFAKRPRIVISDHPAYLNDLIFRISQQFLRLLHAHLRQIFYKFSPVFSLNRRLSIVWVHIKLLCKHIRLIFSL